MSNVFKSIGDAAAKTVNWIPHTTAAEKRAQMQLTTEQIGLYKSQKEELAKTRKDTEEQKSIERAKINEKTIRSRRNQFRTKSASDSTETGELKNTLG